MSHHRLTPSVHRQENQLAEALSALRTTLELPGPFPEDALREAKEAVAGHELPELDFTHIEFVTIDPASSTDLDQALFIDRSGEGYKVFYAIADVPSFVAPGGALDAETRRRGQTFYTPDGRIPLHPEVISEEAGSLLAGQTLCRVRVGIRAGRRRRRVRRCGSAGPRSAAAPSSVTRGCRPISTPAPPRPCCSCSRKSGIKRVELERLRGGASLNMPEQEIEQLPDGGYRIVAAPPLPVEDWNAQISLMTGMAAAGIMLEGKVGILRTMPAPDAASLAHFHRQTRALGKPWDGEMSYGEYLRTLDPTDPQQLAIVHSAGMLFRGAGYTPFDGTVPEAAIQAAIGAAYAHSTAPLRRLIDRFVLVICEALSNGTEVPAWAREALPSLPSIMAASDQLAAKLERLSLDTVEAALLVNHVGQEFDAVVISGSKPARNGKNGNGKNGNGGTKPGNGNGPSGIVQIAEPAVTARCPGELEPGTQVRVRIVSSDIATREVRLELVG